MDKKYRLYIDESGTHNYPADKVTDANRYLSLTGVIIENSYYVSEIQPRVRDIKLLVASDPDNLPILHREDILAFKGDFIKLKDQKLKKNFDNSITDLLSATDYTVCTVVLDKVSHLDKYGASAYHPYTYCLNVILEKYTHCLHSFRAKGDVMAEARGKKEDRILEEEYKKFYSEGTKFRSSDYIQSVLTSNEIKIRKKENNVDGLEIADILTLASKIDVLHAYGVIGKLDINFQTMIIRNIQRKYHRGGNVMKGFGKKFLG